MVWGAYLLGEDEHGTWLCTPERSMVRGRRRGVSATSFVGAPEEPGLDVLHLVPADGEWWFGTCAVDRVGPRTAIDICSPLSFTEDEWSYVDLELDLYRRQSAIGIFDDDEFDEAFNSGLITATERELCLSTASRLDSRLRDGDDLFDEAVWDHLAAGVGLGLPPLSEVRPP